MDANDKCEEKLTLLNVRGNKVILECQQHKRHRGMHSNEITSADDEPVPRQNHQIVTLVFWGSGNKVKVHRKKTEDLEFHAVNRYTDLD